MNHATSLDCKLTQHATVAVLCGQQETVLQNVASVGSSCALLHRRQNAMCEVFLSDVNNMYANEQLVPCCSSMSQCLQL